MALQFAPFNSEIELPFYTALSQSKIDHDRLDDSARTVLGLYEPRAAKPQDSSRMRVLGNALTSDDVPPSHIRAEGKIKNVNTIEDFKNIDKTAILQTAAKQIWDAINDGTIYSIPSLLSSFSILSFANLKKYTFTYWFAFPALHSDPVWTMATEEPQQLTAADTNELVEEVGTWKYGTDSREHGFFLAKKVALTSSEAERPPTPGASGSGLSYKWVIGSLHKFEKGFFRGVDPEDQFVSFVDPSTYPDNPGWMLRNLLVLIRRRFKLDKVQILSYRDVHARRHEARSRIFLLETTQPGQQDSNVMPRVTGWERNSLGKLSAKVTSLAQYMDPTQLADQAVDLNLKLMKWRIAPDLNLEKLKETKCLLLGAGTLGSYVSRALMAWGVRKITFIDNANVSFSNPVRQPLFDHKDCLDGGAKKAYRAAEALQEIYPNVDSTGHVLGVPMLGHPIEDEVNTRLDFETLEKLIEDHDAIFLLMDTRESRWLPTVMGKAAGKIVMNAALGFDTYVVMRHGVTATDGGPAALGCYFCNDVVAPADSVKDQTLDQQCTVTRPGVAAMASNLLVEVLVSILQHPLGSQAPAPLAKPSPSTSSITYERDPPDHPLGIIPHQIRGFLSTFENKIISGQSYDCCSACSPKIVNEYRRNGWEFVKKALTNQNYVTELSGLAEVQRIAEAAAENVDWDSESEISEDEGEGELL